MTVTELLSVTTLIEKYSKQAGNLEWHLANNSHIFRDGEAKAVQQRLETIKEIIKDLKQL